MVLKPLRPAVVEEHLGVLRVWRDDLAEMVAVFRAGIGEERLVIRTDDYALDDIDDLAGLRERRLRRLLITSEGGEHRLELSSDRCMVTVQDPSLQLRGAVTELSKIANRCQRPGRIKHTHSAILIGFLVFAWVLAQTVQTVVEDPMRVYGRSSLIFASTIVIAAGVLALIAGVITPFGMRLLGAIIPWGERSIIYTRTRTEAPSFWRRKSDDIWIALVSLVLGLILGGVIGYWISKITQ